MIQQAVANSFRLDLLTRMSQDVFRIALYTDASSLGENTTVYTTDGEVIGPGYNAGGLVLSGFNAVLEGRLAYASWANPVWPNATITARGALIYNFSQGNRAVGVIDLGKNYTSTNGSFTVTLPEPSAKTALIRIG